VRCDRSLVQVAVAEDEVRPLAAERVRDEVEGQQLVLCLRPLARLLLPALISIRHGVAHAGRERRGLRRLQIAPPA
jgi:hypothetical protein